MAPTLNSWTILQWLTAGSVGLVAVLSPWFFGAWESWWFWPFTALIFAGSVLLALQWLSSQQPPRLATETDSDPTSPTRHTRVSIAFLSFSPFLLYALVRSLQTEVRMDAERSFLRMLTPFLLAVQITYGITYEQAKRLSTIILVNFGLLGSYGLINHAVTGSQLVLWREAYPQYAGRLTGAYFCPDHFAGLMEMALGLALALFLTRGFEWRLRLGTALLIGIALAVVALSKSRGAGITVVGIMGAALMFGFSQWPRPIRRYFRIVAGSIMLLLIIAFCWCASGYRQRFLSYFAWSEARQQAPVQMAHTIFNRLRVSDRGLMIAGAIRAWKTAPLWGIGPGMHQNLWPHFAASPDGDRAVGCWPSHPNYTFFSYEVHSDWMQLLEEYGLAGFILFGAAAGVVCATLLGALRAETAALRSRDWKGGDAQSHAWVVGAIFAVCAMAIHSLGDFNLQIPSNVWILGAIMGLAGHGVARITEGIPAQETDHS